MWHGMSAALKLAIMLSVGEETKDGGERELGLSLTVVAFGLIGASLAEAFFLQVQSS